MRRSSIGSAGSPQTGTPPQEADLPHPRRPPPPWLPAEDRTGIPPPAGPPPRRRERSELLQRLTQVAANPPPRLRDRDQVARTSETALEPRVRRPPSDVDGVLVVEGLGQRVETAENGIEALERLIETACRPRH